MERTVYLINGFLESGKTTFIKELLRQDYFNNDEKKLLILCEEGDEEYEESFCEKYNVIIRCLGSESQFTPQTVAAMVSELQPQQILVEFNGMWNIGRCINRWDFGSLAEITIIDAQYFEIYLKNLKSLLINQVRNASMIVFRSCDKKRERLAAYRRSIRAVNPAAVFIFKNNDGERLLKLDDDLPYDINHGTIELSDADFGIFYIDIMESIKRYLGKKVRFRGYIFKKRPSMLLIGWQAITCCMEDLTTFAFICDTEDTGNFEENQWVLAEGLIQEEYFETIQRSIPVIRLLWVETSPAPEEKFITVN